MKSILIALAAVLMLASCSPEPDNVIYGTNTDTSQSAWQYDSVAGKPVQVPVITYTVSPTWGQANHWAYATGQWLFTFLGILFLSAAAYLFYLKMQGKELSVFLIFGLLVASLAFLGTKPGSIKWNNDKQIPKEEYLKLIENGGTLKPFWDAQFEQNKILWGAHK